MNLAKFEAKVKSSKAWKFSSIFFNFILNLTWRLTLGLKPTILYALFSGGSSDKELKRSGLKIFHGDEHFTDFAEWLATRIPEELISSEITRMEADGGLQSFSTTIEKKLDLETRFELLRFALDDKNIGAVCGYLKFVPKLSSIKILLNRPTLNTPLGSQLWHRDWFNFKAINIFTAITDIHETKGMYSAIGFDSIARYSEIPVHDNDPDVDIYSRDRVGTENMSLYVDSEAVKNLKGPPGTTALVDSGWVYHKGGFVTEDYRLMIQISYQSEDKPPSARAENVLESLNLVEHEQLDSLLDTGVRRYMTKSEKNKRTLSWVFHWLARRFTYFKVKGKSSQHQS